MKTSYPTGNTQIIDIAHGGTGATSAADARRNLAVPANALGVGETSVFHLIDDQNTYQLHVRHDFDNQNALEIYGSETGLRYHVKENGLWTTKPTAISSGGTGATSRKQAANNLGLELRDGQTFNGSSEIVMGYITNDSKQLMLSIDFGMHTYEATGIIINTLNGILRGDKGYLDSNNGVRNLLASPFSARAYFKHSTLIHVIVDKTSQFTNVTNNTPVACYLTYSFVYHGGA